MNALLGFHGNKLELSKIPMFKHKIMHVLSLMFTFVFIATKG